MRRQHIISALDHYPFDLPRHPPIAAAHGRPAPAPAAGRMRPPRPGGCRIPPHRHPDRRGQPSVRGFPLPDAVSVRRTDGRSRHAAATSTAACGPASGREAWGFGSMTLGNAWAFPAAPQDAGLGAMKALAGRLRSRHRRLRRDGAPRRSGPRARPGLPSRRDAAFGQPGAAGADSQAVHARGGERLRRRAARRVRQSASASAATRPTARSHMSRDLSPISGRRSTASISIATCRLRRGRDAGLPLGRRERSARGGRRPQRDRRRAAEHARGVDSARRAHPLQDQAEWRATSRPTTNVSSGSIAS